MTRCQSMCQCAIGSQPRTAERSDYQLCAPIGSWSQLLPSTPTLPVWRAGGAFRFNRPPTGSCFPARRRTSESDSGGRCVTFPVGEGCMHCCSGRSLPVQHRGAVHDSVVEQNDSSKLRGQRQLAQHREVVAQPGSGSLHSTGKWSLSQDVAPPVASPSRMPQVMPAASMREGAVSKSESAASAFAL